MGKLCCHWIYLLGTFLFQLYIFFFNSLVLAKDAGLRLQFALLKRKAEQAAHFLRILPACFHSIWRNSLKREIKSPGQFSSFSWPCQAVSSFVPVWLVVFSETGTLVDNWTVITNSFLINSKAEWLQPLKSWTSSTREPTGQLRNTAAYGNWTDGVTTWILLSPNTPCVTVHVPVWCGRNNCIWQAVWRQYSIPFCEVFETEP